MFQESLEKLVKSVDGALGAAVMNRNGVIVEHVLNNSDSHCTLDGLPELGPIFEQLDGMRDVFDPGSYRSCVIRGTHRSTLIRPLDGHYMAMLWVVPTTLLGKAKFKLRAISPDLIAQL